MKGLQLDGPLKGAAAAQAVAALLTLRRGNAAAQAEPTVDRVQVYRLSEHPALDDSSRRNLRGDAHPGVPDGIA